MPRHFGEIHTGYPGVFSPLLEHQLRAAEGPFTNLAPWREIELHSDGTHDIITNNLAQWRQADLHQMVSQMRPNDAELDCVKCFSLTELNGP